MAADSVQSMVSGRGRGWLSAGLLACLVAWATLLGGCAVTAETRAKSAPGALKLEADQGLLALKITSNRPAVSTFFVKWSTLRVKNVATQETTAILERSDSSAGHALFVQPLPAGEYQVEAVGNQASGWMTITEGARAGQVLPRFRIEPRRLTDLGTLVYVRRHYPINSSLFRWAQQDSPHDRTGVMRQLDPALASVLSAQTTLGWNEGLQLQLLQLAYDESRRRTLRAASPLLRPDGSLLLGESFGQIAVRSPAGLWTWIQTPTALPIRAVHQDLAGALFAGSDDGLLLVRQAHGTAWQAVDLPASDASVVHIGQLPGTEQLLVVLQTRDRFVALAGVPGQLGQWVQQFSQARDLFSNPAFDAHSRVLVTGDRVAVVMGGVQSSMAVGLFDAGAAQWRIVPQAETSLPAAWAAMPGGGLGRFRGIPLTGMGFTSSADGGVTWAKRGDLNWAGGSLLFTSERVGYVVRTESIPAFDPEKFGLSIWRTDDAGQSWAAVGTTPASAGQLIRLAGGPEAIAYVSANGQFFASSDGGKTWKLERQVD